MSNSLKVAAISPRVFLADPIANARTIVNESKVAAFEGADVIVFPKNSITGNSVGDLVYQETLEEDVVTAIKLVANETKDIDALVVISYPYKNVINAMALYMGKGLCLSNNMSEAQTFEVPTLEGVFFGLYFDNNISSDSDIRINLLEGTETLGSSKVKLNNSLRFSKDGSAVITCSSGFGESTAEGVHTGYKCIAQGGKLFSKGCARNHPTIYADIDIDAIKKRAIFDSSEISKLEYLPKMPYLPAVDTDKELDKALDIQARALEGRMRVIGCKKAVIGVSGGLDSTLALIATCKAFDIQEIDRRNITAVTMPCFGTSSKTRNYALRLMKALGVRDLEIDISKAVENHLLLIGHDINDKNIAYENAQARERTQVLMDIANDIGAIVIGTGDMSEAALGWCTYGGDALSNYNINAGVPKTLAKLVVKRYAEQLEDETLSKLLLEIVDLPISPELLSSGSDEITQKTEDAIGPYILHDFYMYYMACGLKPITIYNMAMDTFSDEYSEEVIVKTLKTFYERFFKNQFKRSAAPDGPQIIGFSLSPRSGFRMPSDVSAKIWLEEINLI